MKSYDPVQSHRFETTLAVDGHPPMHLRLIDGSDAEELYSVTVDNPDLGEYLWWTRKIGAQKDVANIVAQKLNEMSQDHAMQYNIIDDVECHKPIVGMVSVYGHIPEESYAKVGYWLVQHARKKGYAHRATKVVLDYAAEKWKLKHVSLDIVAGNSDSEALAQRLGFTLVKGHSFPTVFIDRQMHVIRNWERGV